MSSPAELEAAAARLDALAATVGATLDHVVAFHRPDVWQGARADRFGVELDEQRARLRLAAQDLADDARHLRAQAALLDTVFTL